MVKDWSEVERGRFFLFAHRRGGDLQMFKAQKTCMGCATS